MTTGRKLVFLCIAGFVAGVGLETVFYYPLATLIWIVLLACVCSVVAYVGTSPRERTSWLSGCGVFLFAVAIGAVYMYGERGYVSVFAPFSDTEIVLTGVVVAEPEHRAETIQLIVRATGDRAYESESIAAHINRAQYRNDGITYGDTVLLRGVLTIPEEFVTDSGRVFPYAEYYRSKGVIYMMRDPDVTVLQHEKDTFRGVLFSAKDAFLSALSSRLPEPYAGLASGILLGVKRALPADLDEAFRRTGIIHIVVLSGYNIMLVVEFVWWIVSFGMRPFARFSVALIAILGFATLVGLSATVVRASIMASILLVSRLLDRPHDALFALACAVFLMILHNPYILAYDPGFQLSCVATAGLILGMSGMERALTPWGMPQWLTRVVAATLCAQIVVLPLLLYYTGMFSIVSVVVNVLVVPFVAPAMLVTFLTGVMHFIFPPLSILVAFIGYGILAYIVSIAEIFSALPLSVFLIPAIPFWLVGCFYASYGALWWYIRERQNSQNPHNDYADWVIECEGMVGVSESGTRARKDGYNE